ncbi:MAG: DUF2961 domain-containing protein [Eubacteriales bacterium]|nr:DUF2961 domain-containing protein [Eubacteriales bacterium]
MSVFEMTNRTSFAYSAENPTGERNGGSKGKDCEKMRPCVWIEPGETLTLCDVQGPGMLTHFWFTGYIGHSFILRIYWEEAEYPSVEAPLSAFFGCAYDENLKDKDGKYPVLNSAMILVAPGRGYNCYWEMPFRRRCRVTIENRSAESKVLYYMISGWRGAISELSGYFHAAYRQEHPVQKGRAYTVIDGIQGKGCFMGISLAAGLNGANDCWVEGEAKIYLDGDQYPTINYTGTEDYFCGSYAFGYDVAMHQYQNFSGLYAGLYAQIGDTGEFYNGQQRFMLYRWHVKDPIYFDKSFRMTLDNHSLVGPRYDDYTTVAYWYQTEPSKLQMKLPPEQELHMK